MVANRDSTLTKATALVLVVELLQGSPNSRIPFQDLQTKALTLLKRLRDETGDRDEPDVAALISDPGWLEENGFTVFEGMVYVAASGPQ